MANDRARNIAPITNTIQHISGLESEMITKKAELKLAEKEVYLSEEKLVLFQIKLGPLSEADFITYAKRKVECAFLKARKLFNEDDDVVRTNKALSTCKVFDI